MYFVIVSWPVSTVELRSGKEKKVSRTMRIAQGLLSVAFVGMLGLNLLSLTGCGSAEAGELAPGPGGTPALSIYPGDHKAHQCTKTLPKADYRRVSYGGRETPAIRVWCYGGTNASDSSNALENLDWKINGARYYLCVDSGGMPSSSSSAQLSGSPETGYFVDCR